MFGVTFISPALPTPSAFTGGGDRSLAANCATFQNSFIGRTQRVAGCWLDRTHLSRVQGLNAGPPVPTKGKLTLLNDPGFGKIPKFKIFVFTY